LAEVAGSPARATPELAAAISEEASGEGPAPQDAPGDDGAASAEPGSGAAGVGEAAAGRRITDRGDDQLSFTFTEDCWVEIKNASGRNLFGDLGRAGSSFTLVGEGPFRILLGYAPGVTLTLNGEQVPLGPHTRNNVASLVLGQ
jgi:cytoskeleton protein RodZ